jgi:hypothetical protein
MNKHSVFIISNLVSMVKENNMVLNIIATVLHFTKHVPIEFTSEFIILFSVPSVQQMQKQVISGQCFVQFHALLTRWIAQQVFLQC